MNLEKLYWELRNAGLPIETISLVLEGDILPPGVVEYPGWWVKWVQPLTPSEQALADSVIAEHDPVDAVVLRAQSAEAQAATIPQWAGVTEEKFQTWWDNNLSDAQVDVLSVPAPMKNILKAQNLAILRLGKMEIAIRNRVFPALEDGLPS